MSFFWSHFQCSNKYYQSYYPAYSYLFLVINRNTRKMRKICLKNNASDVELVPLLSTLNILQTLFKYFYCWIWTSKYRFFKAFMTFFWGNRFALQIKWLVSLTNAILGWIKWVKCHLLSYRNQSTGLQEWFLHDENTNLKWVSAYQAL